MGYVVRFVGILLLVNASTTHKVSTNKALLPMWVATDTFCVGKPAPGISDATVPEHAAFIRVPKGSVIEKLTKWPAGERSDCDAAHPGTTTPQNCLLFRIPVASHLTVDAGFTPPAMLGNDGSFCLIGQLAADFKTEAPGLDLIDDPVSATILDFDLPGGTMTAKQLTNTMTVPSIAVPAPKGSKPHPIAINAKPRDNSAARTLVVKAGTEITVVHLPPEEAGDSFSAKHQLHGGVKHAHFFLLNKLLPKNKELCTLPPKIHFECQQPQIPGQPGTGTDTICSPGGCCG